LNRARIDCATQALALILPFTRPADSQLRYFFRGKPKLGSGDRAFVADAVYAALRHLRSLTLLARSNEARTLILAALIKYRGLNLRELAPFVSAAEAQLLTEIKAANLEMLPLAARTELPDWLLEKLTAAYDEMALLEMMRALNRPAALDLRVNTFAADRDEVLSLLNAEGIRVQATPFSPFGIRLPDNPAINRHRLFLEGKIEVQDEASQIVCLLVAPKPREFIADFCAGAGGKTLMLGALMRSSGRVYALDIRQERLAKLSPRLKRSRLSNVHTQLIAEEHDTRVKRLAGKMDRVLVDAPCSGLGTLRRNPDLKWRQSAHSVSELAEKQAAILRRAANLVKRGGRLVYATCSILPEENDDIVADFAASQRDFSRVPCNEILAAKNIPLDTGELLRLFPHRHGTDGFFAAVMERNG
jgi:16S rRNA (cytosine967-C5)-methyltransferase